VHNLFHVDTWQFLERAFGPEYHVPTRLAANDVGAAPGQNHRWHKRGHLAYFALECMGKCLPEGSWDRVVFHPSGKLEFLHFSV